MAKLHSTYLLHCLTSVHAGDGSSTGTIDNPIQKERTTKFPVIRDSTLRGGVRESFWEDLKNNPDERFLPTFGSKKDGEKNSALSVYPARILFFPVRSFSGVFTYVTCPFVLKRFVKDMKLFHEKNLSGIAIPDVEDMETVATKNIEIPTKKQVGLEEFLFTVKIEKNDESNNPIFIKEDNKWLNLLPDNKNLAIISDTAFKYFVNLFTEKVTRNKIDPETGTATGGALFNVEYLPEESILYATFGFGNEFSTDSKKSNTVIQEYFTGKFKGVFEVGGDKSIGKGLLLPYYALEIGNNSITTKKMMMTKPKRNQQKNQQKKKPNKNL